MDLPQIERIIRHPINHIGFSVRDLETTIEQWARTLGVGPFFVVEDIAFDEATHHGAPCVFEHSAAFAKWGDVFVELQQIDTLRPAPLAELLRADSAADCVVNHLAFMTPTAEEDSARLEQLGLPAELHLRSGPVVEWIHAAPFLGHALEVHQASDFLDGFWAQIAEASDRWDGCDPIRPMAAP